MALVPGKQRPLRTVVLCTSSHLGSIVIANMVARAPEFEVVGIVRTDTVDWSPAGRRKAKKQFFKIGPTFAWLLLWQQLLVRAFLKVGRYLPGRRRWVSCGDLAQEQGFPLLEGVNINNPQALHWLEGRQADVVISACFTQILKADAIAAPRLGVLNVHPAPLPEYRGAMSYFWTLQQGDTHAGASVHWIDEGIDTGQLLGCRRWKIGPRATQQRVLVRSAAAGARMLRRVGRDLIRGGRPAVVPAGAACARYFPMPDRDAFVAYFRRFRFFRIRDLRRMLLKPA